jgi:hypothetical protein
MLAVAGRRAGPDDRHRAQARVTQIGVASHPQGPGPSVAEHVELPRPPGVARAEQPDAVPAPGIHRDLGRHVTEPRTPPLQPPAQTRNSARSGRDPALGQRGDDLGGRADPKQGTHGGVTRFRHTGQRGPGQPVPIGGARHRLTPSHRPSA